MGKTFLLGKDAKILLLCYPILMTLLSVKVSWLSASVDSLLDILNICSNSMAYQTHSFPYKVKPDRKSYA